MVCLVLESRALISGNLFAVGSEAGALMASEDLPRKAIVP